MTRGARVLLLLLIQVVVLSAAGVPSASAVDDHSQLALTTCDQPDPTEALNTPMAWAVTRARLTATGPPTTGDPCVRAQAEKCSYANDYRPDFARPTPAGAVAHGYDTATNPVDPAANLGRVRRAALGLGVQRVAPSTAARLSTPSSRALGANLEAAGMVRPTGSAAHHIVAGGSQRAADARAVLARYGIDINAAENGVFLPLNRAAPNPTGAAVHSTLHTNSYYSTVNDLLLSATSRSEALDALAYVRQSLRGGGL